MPGQLLEPVNKRITDYRGTVMDVWYQCKRQKCICISIEAFTVKTMEAHSESTPNQVILIFESLMYEFDLLGVNRSLSVKRNQVDCLYRWILFACFYTQTITYLPTL